MPEDTNHKPSVFINYRRIGGFYLARHIYDDLRRESYDVFMDIETLKAGKASSKKPP